LTKADQGLSHSFLQTKSSGWQVSAGPTNCGWKWQGHKGLLISTHSAAIVPQWGRVFHVVSRNQLALTLIFFLTV